MKLKEMSKDEKSLLLFLETRAVDYGGRVNTLHMNKEDFEIAEKWNEIRFIGFGRIVARHCNRDGNNWCKLSDEAFKLAHQERVERSKRMWMAKDWITTDDNIEMHGDPHFSGKNNPLNKLNKQMAK